MKRLDIRNVALIAVMTALIRIFGPMSIPIGAVSFPLTLLLVYLAAYILGMRNGIVVCLIYLLIGFVGVPAMSGCSGGPTKILGPTDGYLVTSILVTLITGFVVERFYRNIPLQAVMMFAALIICYAADTAWFVGQTKMALSKAFAVCVCPSVPFDYIKLGLAIIIGRPVREQLRGLLQARSAASLV